MKNADAGKEAYWREKKDKEKNCGYFPTAGRDAAAGVDVAWKRAPDGGS